MAMLIYGSLHTTPPGEAGAFSLDGYRAMLSRANGLVLLNTIGLSLVKTGLSMALALFLAWIVARTDTPHRETARGPHHVAVLHPADPDRDGVGHAGHAQGGPAQPGLDGADRASASRSSTSTPTAASSGT